MKVSNLAAWGLSLIVQWFKADFHRAVSLRIFELGMDS